MSPTSVLRPPHLARGGRLPRIEDYRLARLLGQGRAAAVYLAEHRRRGSSVALKVPRTAAGGHDSAGRRFAMECEMLASIRSKHVVRAIEHQHGGPAYLAMEYLAGGTLRERMRGAIQPAVALRWLQQAALGLQALHARGIVHRDVKPENLLARESGELVLVDLGVAAHHGEGACGAAAGTLIGTARYAAPEQLQGAAPSPSADVYSLGILLYELLCGRPPFPGATALELLAQHTVAVVPRLSGPLARFQPLVNRMLDKRPPHRAADAGALLRDIEQVAECAADDAET
jgi:serine/threonine protein kinase